MKVVVFDFELADVDVEALLAASAGVEFFKWGLLSVPVRPCSRGKHLHVWSRIVRLLVLEGKLVNLVEVEENVEMVRLDPEEKEDVPGPVHLVLDHHCQELFNVFDGRPCFIVEDLSDVLVSDLLVALLFNLVEVEDGPFRDTGPQLLLLAGRLLFDEVH